MRQPENQLKQRNILAILVQMSRPLGDSSSFNQHVHLTRGVSYLIMQTLGGNAIAIVSFIIVARLITTKEMGIWAILQLFTATCATFVNWFPPAVTKYVAENISRGSKRTAAAAFYQSILFNLILYIPTQVGIYFSAASLARYLLGDASYALLFQVLAIDVFFSTAAIPLVTAAMLGLEMFREIASVGLIVGGISRQILIILFIVLMRSFVGLVIGWVISDVTQTLIYSVYTVRALGAPTFDFSLMKLFRYYFPLELSNIVTYAQSWFDRALLVAFVPLATLGIYNAAVTAFGVLTGVQLAMGNMLFSAYSKLEGQMNLSNANRAATRYASFVLTPLAFGLMATARPALALFVGEAYLGGSVPLMVFCGAYAFVAFTTVLGPVFMAMEETKINAFVTAVSVMISLAAAYILLPEWGVEGAAAARALAIVLGAILSLLMLRRKMTLQIDFRGIGKIVLAGTTMAAVLFAIQLVISSKLLLPIDVLVGAVVYFGMLRILKAVNADDLNLLNRFLGRRLSIVSKALIWILAMDHP